MFLYFNTSKETSIFKSEVFVKIKANGTKEHDLETILFKKTL